jgi:hypothetical protein
MKAKSILVLILTLIIGVVLGMLTSAQIRHQRFRPVKFFHSEEKLREIFYHTIKPDEKQKAELEPILDKYAKINRELQNNFRKEMDASVSELRREIEPRLTRDQLARLKEMDKKRQEMIRHGHRKTDRDSIDHVRHKRGIVPVPDDTIGLPDKK